MARLLACVPWRRRITMKPKKEERNPVAVENIKNRSQGAGKCAIPSPDMRSTRALPARCRSGKSARWLRHRGRGPAAWLAVAFHRHLGIPTGTGVCILVCLLVRCERATDAKLSSYRRHLLVLVFTKGINAAGTHTGTGTCTDNVLVCPLSLCYRILVTAPAPDLVSALLVYNTCMHRRYVYYMYRYIVLVHVRYYRYSQPMEWVVLDLSGLLCSLRCGGALSRQYHRNGHHPMMCDASILRAAPARAA